MNLEEHLDSLRKNKPRKIVDIDVDEITLCGAAANRKKFYIKKREESMNEFKDALSLVEEFLDDEDIKKAVSAKKFRQAMEKLIILKSDISSELNDALKTILKWVAGNASPKKTSEEDPFPSIPIVGPASVIEKMADNIDDDEEDDDEEWG